MKIDPRIPAPLSARAELSADRQQAIALKRLKADEAYQRMIDERRLRIGRR